MRIKNKLHYILKYIVLALPILLLLGHMFAPIDTYYPLVEDTINDFVGFFSSTTIAQYYVQALVQSGLVNDFAGYSYVNGFLIVYPLYIFYVYLFDMLVDILTFLPKFFHDLLNKDYMKQ